MCIMTEYYIRSDNMSAEIRLLIAALKMSQISDLAGYPLLRWSNHRGIRHSMSYTSMVATANERKLTSTTALTF